MQDIENFKEYNLIIIGTPKTKPFLEEAYAMTDVTIHNIGGADANNILVISDPDSGGILIGEQVISSITTWVDRDISAG